MHATDTCSAFEMYYLWVAPGHGGLICICACFCYSLPNTAGTLCIQSWPVCVKQVTCPQNVFICMFWQCFLLFPPLTPKTYDRTIWNVFVIIDRWKWRSESKMCSAPKVFCQMALNKPLHPNLILKNISKCTGISVTLTKAARSCKIKIALWLWWHEESLAIDVQTNLLRGWGFTLMLWHRFSCGWVDIWKEKGLGCWQSGDSEHIMALAALDTRFWSIFVSDWSFFLWKVFFGVLTKWWYWLPISKGTFWIHSYVCN